MARVEGFSITELIEDLKGTCKTIEEFLPEGMGREDITEEELEELDQEIFNCETCNWWYEQAENVEGETCSNCGEDEENEDDDDDY